MPSVEGTNLLVINKAIYFDSAATTCVVPEVCAAMLPHLDGSSGCANPSAGQHEPGRRAAETIERARADVAAELQCAANDIIFTSGATESINLALRGVALDHFEQGRHIVTTRIEHKATLACCDSLVDEGFEVSRIPPGRDGRVDPSAVADAVRSDTLLISVMHTKNVTGAMQPLAEIAAIAKQSGRVLADTLSALPPLPPVVARWASIESSALQSVQAVCYRRNQCLA